MNRSEVTLIVWPRVVHNAMRPVLGGFFAPHPTGVVSLYP